MTPAVTVKQRASYLPRCRVYGKEIVAKGGDGGDGARVIPGRPDATVIAGRRALVWPSAAQWAVPAAAAGAAVTAAS